MTFKMISFRATLSATTFLPKVIYRAMEILKLDWRLSVPNHMLPETEGVLNSVRLFLILAIIPDNNERLNGLIC